MSRQFDDNYNQDDFYSNDLRSDSGKYNDRPSRYERYGDKNMRYNRSRDDQSRHSGFRDRSREDNSRFNHSHDNHHYNSHRQFGTHQLPSIKDKKWQTASSVENFKKGNSEIKEKIDTFLEVVKQNDCFLNNVEKFRVHLDVFLNNIEDITNSYHLRVTKGKETLTVENRRWLIEIAVNTLNIFHDSVFGEWERIIKFKLDPTFTVQRIENKCRKKLISKRMAEYVFTEPKLYSEISEPLIIKQGLLLGLTIMGKEVDFYMKSNSFREKLTEIKNEMLKVVQCSTQDEMDCLFASGFPLFDTSMDEDIHLYDFYAIKEATMKFFDMPMLYGDGSSKNYGIQYNFPNPDIDVVVETFAKGGSDQFYCLDRLFSKCLAMPPLKESVVESFKKFGFDNIADIFINLNIEEFGVDVDFPAQFNDFEQSTYPPDGFYNRRINSERIKKVSDDQSLTDFINYLTYFKSKKKSPVTAYITFKCGRELEMFSVLTYFLFLCEKNLYILDIKALKHDRIPEMLEAVFNNEGIIKILESPIDYRVLFGHYNYCLNLKTPIRLHFLSYIISELHKPNDLTGENPLTTYSDRYLDLIAGANELYIPGGDTKDKKFLLSCLEERSEKEVRKIKKQMNNALSRLIKSGISFPKTVQFVLGTSFDKSFVNRTEWHRRPILIDQEVYMIVEIKALYECVQALLEYARKIKFYEKIFNVRNITFSSVDSKEYGKYLGTSFESK
ncbi:Ribonuclease H-like domain-containing protein [Strongyloides ratti]|uniref:Ribonuclease H-like domain-containing protein n=1 Tax=Strongyloides ratti TaxID=34506 RepID=A0A090LET9_STRRB|nr:Ribonuclease H-like domain-containing protein [Strongyloides ratti]CEF66050.1 Ribonuclease H-like domain-containing protein [Strongyloides ratti]